MKGIDISNNNGAINFTGVKNSGVECVYIKATEGTTFQDSYKSAFYGGAKSIGAKVGFYHFLVGTSAPETQAENFYKEIISYQNDLVPMLDVEVNFPGLNDYIARFIGRFNQLTSMEIGLYTYTSFLNEYIDVERFKTLKLWEANYNNSPWNLHSNGFTNRIGHQYTEKGTIGGVNGNCDVNEFNEGVLNGNKQVVVNNATTQINLTLRDFQQQYNMTYSANITVDGLYGPETEKAINNTLIKEGQENSLVGFVQCRVGATLDYIFGPVTKQCVVVYQNYNGLLADGIAGPQTFRKLLGL